MDDLDIERLLDAGPRVGPTRAELQAAVAAAGNQHAAGFGERVLAALPRHYSMAEIMRALDGLGQVPHAGGGGEGGS